MRAYSLWRQANPLSNELDPRSPMPYLEMMLVHGEIYAERLRLLDDDNKSSPLRDFHDFSEIDDDLLHLRLSAHKVSPLDAVRAFMIHHQHYAARKKTLTSVKYARLAIEVLDEYPDVLSAPCPSWRITGTTGSREALQKTVTALENSRSMNMLNTFHEEGRFAKVVEVLTSQTEEKNLRDKSEEERQAALQRLYMLVDAQWNLDDFSGCLEACARALSLVTITAPSEEIGNLLKTVEVS